MFMFRKHKAKPKAPPPPANKGIGNNKDRISTRRNQFLAKGLAKTLAPPVAPPVAAPAKRETGALGYQIGNKGRLVSAGRAKQPPSDPAPITSNVSGTQAAQNSRDQHFPEVLNDLPAGVDPQGNPVQPKKQTNDERSFFDALDTNSPNVDWIENRAGDPDYRPINTTTRLRAAVGQRIGTFAVDDEGLPCERCSRGLGPFASCKIVNLKGKPKFNGACMNCTFSGAATKCSHRWSGSRPGTAEDAGKTIARVTPAGAVAKPRGPPPARGLDPRANEEMKQLRTLLESLTKGLEATQASIDSLREEQKSIRSLVNSQPNGRPLATKLTFEREDRVTPGPKRPTAKMPATKIGQRPIPYADESISGISSSDSSFSGSDSSDYSTDDD